MKKETIKILEKQIRTCPECGKEFLGISLNAYYGYNGDYKHSSSDIYKYPLKCRKCPDCADKCYGSNGDGLIEYVKKNGDIPCDKDYTINEFFDNEKYLKKENLNDYTKEEILEYIESAITCEDKDKCYQYFHYESDSGYFNYGYQSELIDLLKILNKEKEKKSESKKKLVDHLRWKKMTRG